MAPEYNHDHENEITLFAETNFRNQKRKFGIKTDDRRRHIYIIGKTGMGKTTLQENFVLADIMAGHGCCYVDPHGDTAEKLLDYIPAHRINDVIYFNPADVDFPIGFNILETENDDQKHLIASGLMGVFKKIWPDVWSPRMEYILINCIHALLDYPGATLLGINRLLVDKDYRARVITKIKDPIVKTFWVAEFTQWSEKYATEAIAPVQNKVGQFLSSSIIRNIVAQVKSTINLRRVMDDGKILIVNLAKGRIGEDNMRLLGGMLVTKIQLAAQERQNVPEKDRRDFYLYVDEFQNFANESFASILSEARKFHLNLTVAHQYIEQLDEKVAAAIFGNVGTIIAMRVGGADATAMETEFAPTFTPEDLVNLAKYQIYLKLMVDGVATPPFSANTLAPIATKTDNQEKVIAVSRERYAEPRHIIEAKVLQWSGMEANTQAPDAPVKAAPIPAALEQAVREFEEKKKQGEQADIIPSGDTTSILPPVTASEEPTLNDANVSDRAVLVPAQSIKESSLDLGDVDTTEYLKIRPERLEAIKASIPQAQGKKQRPDFPHTCSRCGKVFNLAIQLDTSRPIYCTDCRPIVAEERKSKQGMIRSVKRTAVPDEKVAAIVRKEDEVRPGFSSASAQPNRPRIIRSEQPAPQVKIVPKADQEDEDLDLLAAIKKAKGEDIVTSKSALEDRAGMTEAISELITKPAMNAKKKRRRSRNKKPQEQAQQTSSSAYAGQKSDPVKREVEPTKTHTLTQGDRVRFDDIDL
ncbi:MAG: type IV secretion system DNA-binding domain-containing protein [Candidatus Nomurabacteria bacterium]|nr:MAG: type IV secretion system DNA-binding domain-containing protein [Candidatus Nomurabacteria bacterium]